MFKLFLKNKKGFSLQELLVAVVLVGLLMGIAGSFLYQLQNSHTISTERWRIQNAVQIASTKFETSSELIRNSKELDIFYDETVAKGIIYDKSDGTFEWKNDVGPYVMPDEGTADENYSYIFSTEAWDTEGNYLGYYMFIKNFSKINLDGKSELFLDDKGFGETPVKVELSIATDFTPPLRNAGETDEEYEKRIVEKEKEKKHSYRNNGINLTLKSGNEKILSYAVETTFVLENVSGSKEVGMNNGKLILEESWVEDNGNTLRAYPCGWSDEYINSGNKENLGYPSLSTTYGDNKNANLQSSQVETKGNVLRFLSPLADMSVDEGENQTTSTHKGSCITNVSFCDGTAASERVLSNLRNFRDEILRGTEFGDWFIEQYYYVWSPFLIEHIDVVKPIYKAVITPISYICNFIAEL